MQKQNILLSGGWLMVSLPVILVCLSCTLHERAPATSPSSQPTAFQSDFVVRLYSVQPEMKNSFVAYLHDCYMSVWQELRNDSIISSANVFELRQIESTTSETPPWSFISLIQLDSRAKPGALLNAERSSGCQEPSISSFFPVLRVEWMSCTPNSCYQIPELTYGDAPDGIDYLIEFIGVEDTPSYLTKYRDLMSTYFGPANGMLVEQGILHAFIALETTEVVFQATGLPGWNQLHISDDWDVDDEVDWDTVYDDLFRREFTQELDVVSTEFPPIRERPIDYLGRLIPDLYVR